MSGLVAKKNSGSGYQNPPAGVHLARCIELIDLGTQTPDNPQYNPSRKLLIRWELPDTKYQIKDDQGNVKEEKPFIVQAEYTLSLGDKSKLKPMLESWRGKAFSAEELEAFEVSILLDIPCQLNLTEKISKNDNKYMIVAAVMPIKMGTDIPKRVYELKKFDIDSFDQAIFDTFSEFVQTKIKASEEYAMKGSANAAQPTQETATGTEKPTAQEDQPDLGPASELQKEAEAEKVAEANQAAAAASEEQKPAF